MQEDLAVTGISRSGRVRKKSSKLMDFESPDDIETRYKHQTHMKSYSNIRQEESQDFAIPQAQTMERDPEEVGTASGSESDYYENTESVISMESDSSVSDEGTAHCPAPANSLYMMEKSTKKKLIVKDGRVVGRAKAQRKDKGKSRITAYMMWAREARNDLLQKHPDMDFSAVSKRLGEMWSNVNYNERCLWKRKAKRFTIQKKQSQQAGVIKIISNPTLRGAGHAAAGHAGPGRPAKRAQHKPPPTPPSEPLVPVSDAGDVVANGGGVRTGACGATVVAAHLRLLGESLAIIGERLKEHEGQIAVSGSVSVLLDTLLCSLAPLLAVTRAIPAIAPPASLLADTLNNIAYIMPGL